MYFKYITYLLESDDSFLLDYTSSYSQSIRI